jgi:hypothetical protein
MPNQEQSADEVFEAALDLPPDQRSAYLIRACRGSPKLRTLVEDLLSDYQRMGNFLDEPVVGRLSSHTVRILHAEPARFLHSVDVLRSERDTPHKLSSS